MRAQRAGLPLVTALVALLCIVTRAEEHTASKDASFTSLITVGVGLGSGWAWAGYGCRDCVFADRLRRRNGSTSSVYAAIMPWGNSILESNLPYSGLSVLDAWVKGSVLSKGMMYLEDTINRRQSHKLTLDTAGKGDARVLAGPTDDGWYHIQVNLVKLSDASGTKLMGLPSMWNRICILDKSGTGYTLQLDTAFLFSSDSHAIQTRMGDPSAPFPCVGTLCNERPVSNAPPSALVPLYDGGDFSVQDEKLVDASTNFIMRLRPNVSNEELVAICNELSTDDPSSRFNGACLMDLDEARVQEGADPASPVEWAFQPFNVASSADLLAMRRTLGSQVLYIERDGTARLDYVPEATIELPGNVANVDAAVPWGLDRIDQAFLPLDSSYSPGALNGKGVHIYVVDTGLRNTHVDFAGRIGESVSFINGYAVASLDSRVTREAIVAEYDCDADDLDCLHAALGADLLPGNDSATVQAVAYWDGNGHGTHVSGIALGTQFGVAKRATLHAVKAMGDDGSGSYSNIIAGMNWVVQHVKRNGWRGVVNMSLGGPRSVALNDAAQQLINAGVPVVTSAGNKYGADACTQSPASNPQSITVASSDQRDKLSSFSNIGSCVDLFAPGTSITSAGIARDTSAAVMSGTSMASPHVAGVAALVLQAYPMASVSTVTTILTKASQNIVFSASTAPRFLQAQQARLAPNYGQPSPSPSPVPTKSPTTSPTPRPATPSPPSNAQPVVMPGTQPAQGKLVPGYS